MNVQIESIYEIIDIQQNVLLSTLSHANKTAKYLFQFQLKSVSFFFLNKLWNTFNFSEYICVLSGFDRAVADAFMKAEEFRITTVTFVMSKCLSLSLFHSCSLVIVV
jgi:hypothetical protein